MLSLFSWWLILQLLSLAALPVAWRMFRNLPDRGYAFARPLGLLLAGYALWLGGMFGLLSNTRGTIALLVAALAAVTWWLARGEVDAIRAFLRSHLRLVLVYEGLFLAVFALWSIYKAFNPEIAYTEKPMELAFLNAILRSDHFPPLDPWLSGFSISYYYFGYLLVALVTKLSGVPASIAYNLAVPLLMALTFTGAFSVVYNLTARGRAGQTANTAAKDGPSRWTAPLLGAFFVTTIGNLEGFLEFLHAKGLGSGDLWKWLDIKNLASAPASPTWYPVDNWWWWRASRVIHDVVLGVDREVIDEFPFFSFMLGDLHPHVLALPFALMALGLALNMALGDWQSGVGGWSLSALRRRLDVGVPVTDLVLAALVLGALGFLNSWDLPTYTALFVLAFAVNRYMASRRLEPGMLGEVIAVAAVVGGLGLLLYLPFYATFQSQASGLGLVFFEKTKLRQYLVIFGPFLWAILPLLAPSLMGALRPGSWSAGRLMAVVPLGLALAALVAIGWWTVALLVALIGLAAWGLLRTASPRPSPAGTRADAAGPVHPEDAGGRGGEAFVLLLIVAGLLLTLVTEFAFIRDTFGNRMNTVFKLYFQAWVLLAIAGAYSIWHASTGRGPGALAGRAAPPAPVLLGAGRATDTVSRVARYSWGAVLVALLLACGYYPVAATYTKANLFAVQPTLDGSAAMAASHPGDYGAIQWLNANVTGAPVIMEATGGEYSDYARISTNTGLPAVLGWGGHELQWRGNYTEPGKREPDIDTAYKTLDKGTALAILRKYNVTYVIAGRMEREKGYEAAALAKFGGFMDVVYDDLGTKVYRMRE